MKSLLARLSVGLALALVMIFILQWWVVNSTIRHMSEEYVNSHLQHDTDNLLGALVKGADGKLQLNPDRINGVFQMPFSGHYYVITAGEQTLYSRSLWDARLQSGAGEAPLGEPFYLEGPRQQTLLILRQRFRKLGTTVEITVAEDMTPLLSDLAKFEAGYSVLTVVVLVIVILLQALLIKRGLKPLDNVRHDIARLAQGETVELGEEVPSEIKPLVQEFNNLLNVMRDRLERSRTAVGNLAHALKTPLTVLARLADDDELKSAPESRSLLQQQTDTIRQIMDRQLKRARLAGGGSAGWQFVPADELPPLVDVMQRIHADKGLEIELLMPPGFISRAEREDMLEMFGNLLDNACKWARHKVRLEIVDAPGLEFIIEDDGPGCPPELRQKLIERGVRVDEGTAGHGLGLAIIKDIVEHYHGKMVLAASERLGGFSVRITLPQASVRPASD